MTTVFQRNVFQFGVFQIDAEVVTPPPPQGAGGIAGSQGHGSYGPAFPRRSVRDLYRQLPPVIEPPAEPDQSESETQLTEAQLGAPSPLPVIMELGGIPITIGLQAPSLNAALQNAILLDDEDAIIAILLSV